MTYAGDISFGVPFSDPLGASKQLDGLSNTEDDQSIDGRDKTYFKASRQHVLRNTPLKLF